MRHSIKFRVSADPVWGSETLPAILTNTHHKFQDCGPFSSGWEKFIYLPASLDYPQAPHIRLRNGNISDEIMLFAPRAKTTDVEDINELAMNVLIGQARALVRARILPSYRRAYAGYKGIVGDRILYAECEAVTEAPAGLCGAYITLAADGRRAETLAWMRRELVAFVGAREVHEVTASFDETLRQLESKFAWACASRKTK